MRFLLLTYLLFLSSLVGVVGADTGNAQMPPCKVKYTFVPGLTLRQQEWLFKHPQGKNPCDTTLPATKAEYVIWFSNQPTQVTYQAPSGTATTTGDVNLHTQVWTPQTKTYDFYYVAIYQVTADNPAVAGKSWQPKAPPVYMNHRSGVWRFHPDEKVLEDALKFIRDQNK